MKYLFLAINTVLAASIPNIASAIDNIQELLYLSVGLFNQLIYIVFSFALLVFFWGLAKFIGSAGNDKAIADGKRLMFWGVITLFVMASVWGIVAFIQDSLDITNFYYTFLFHPAPIV